MSRITAEKTANITVSIVVFLRSGNSVPEINRTRYPVLRIQHSCCADRRRAAHRMEDPYYVDCGNRHLRVFLAGYDRMGHDDGLDRFHGWVLVMADVDLLRHHGNRSCKTATKCGCRLNRIEQNLLHCPPSLRTLAGFFISTKNHSFYKMVFLISEKILISSILPRRFSSQSCRRLYL